MGKKGNPLRQSKDPLFRRSRLSKKDEIWRHAGLKEEDRIAKKHNVSHQGGSPATGAAIQAREKAPG